MECGEDMGLMVAGGGATGARARDGVAEGVVERCGGSMTLKGLGGGGVGGRLSFLEARKKFCVGETARLKGVGEEGAWLGEAVVEWVLRWRRTTRVGLEGGVGGGEGVGSREGGGGVLQMWGSG